MKGLRKSRRLDATVADLTQAEPEAIPLTWLTTDHLCGTVRYDLSEFETGYAGGDARKEPFEGRPDFIRELAPALRELTRGVSPDVGERRVVALRHFFRFLDRQKHASGKDVSLRAITSETGYLYRSYLLETPRRVNPVLLANTHEILEVARRLAGLTSVEWPIIRKSNTPQVHRDVDPLAVARIRAFALRRFRRGLPVDLEATTPAYGDDPLDPACVSGVILEDIEAAILDDASLSEDRQKFRTQAFAHHRRAKRMKTGLNREETTPAYIARFVPTSEEVMAAYVVIAAETGWIDTAKGIDITGQWFIPRDLNESHPDSQDRGIVIARRPKTRDLMRHVSTMSPLSVHGIVRRLDERSRFMRELVQSRIDAVRNGIAQSSDPENEIQRLETRLRSPFLFYSHTAKGVKRVEMIDSAWRHFEDLKKALLATRRAQSWSDEEREAISAIQFSDFRDGFADRVFEESGGNLFAVKAALGHRRTSSTTHYLAQRRQVAASFQKFAAFTGVLIEEVESGFRIDPKILMARCYTADQIRTLSPEQRATLSGPRTRMGMGCSAPTDPPAELAPGHRSGDICSVQRCVLCRHGYFFPNEPGAMSALAERLGEIHHARTTMPIDLFNRSSLNVEMTGIAHARDTFFSARSDEFEAIAEAARQDISEGRRPSIEPPHGASPGSLA